MCNNFLMDTFCIFGDDILDEQGTPQSQIHPLGIFFTILGTILLDFSNDVCGSPVRAYLLESTIPGDIIHN